MRFVLSYGSNASVKEPLWRSDSHFKAHPLQQSFGQVEFRYSIEPPRAKRHTELQLMRAKTTLVLVLEAFTLLLPGLVLAQSPAEARGEALATELNCASCHTELPLKSSLRQRTPDLSSAGLRYHPAYLLEFLQKPEKVRRNLGRARMPNFHLSEKEALALTAFLETQRQIPGDWPSLPATVQAHLQAQSAQVSREDFQRELAGGLACVACHTLEGKGGVLGIELANVGHRLQRPWLITYLVAPSMFGVEPATMPAQFYQIAPDRKGFQEITPRAADRIQTVSDYLLSLSTAKRASLETRHVAAKAAYPDATPAVGERLFQSLNCAGCHRHQSIQPRLHQVAPDLNCEGIRVNRPWLANYLKHPVPIRPFGNRPGDGARMPDFRLSDEEAADIAEFLHARREGASGLAGAFSSRRLSAFSQQKAKLLLTEKLSCLGCHRLDEQGGRIGPDLSSVAARLQPEYVYGIIRNPRAVAPHSVMPRISLTDDTALLITRYLVQRTNQVAETKYLSPLEHGLTHWNDVPPNEASPRQSYLTYCAACHGQEGRGDGFNARFLPKRPTVHADASYLATRPDDTLYDGIHSGGYVLNKSHLMPPWGETFSPKEIRQLVAHMRTLCRCEGPAWSRDGSIPAQAP
jgi:mono/diheme cytochrome c family protein